MNFKKILPVRHNISGLKCDNVSCDYYEHDVNVRDYRRWLNQPCPKCGENLLTEADFEMVKTIRGTIFMFNLVTLPVWPLFWLLEWFGNGKEASAQIDMNGTGVAKIKIKENN